MFFVLCLFFFLFWNCNRVDLRGTVTIFCVALSWIILCYRYLKNTGVNFLLSYTLSKFFGRRTSPLIEHRTNASLVDGYFWTKNSLCAMRQLGGGVHMKGLGPLWFLRKNDGQRVMFLRSYSLPRSSQFFNQRAGIVICSSFGLNSKF